MSDKQTPKDPRWDASNPYMKDTVRNLRALVVKHLPEHTSMFTDQDMLDHYAEAYLCEGDTDEVFIEILQGEVIAYEEAADEQARMDHDNRP